MIDPNQFEVVDEKFAEMVMRGVNNAPFPKYVGLVYEEVRKDYARMRLPFKPELNQPAGIVHGGAIATLIDTCVVGTVVSGIGEFPRKMVTVDMHIHYLDAAVEEDLIAHGAVRRRGYRMVYLEVDVVGEKSGKVVAHGELSYLISQ